MLGFAPEQQKATPSYGEEESIFSDTFIFASNSKHQKMIKYLGGAAKCHLVLWWADWFLREF